MSTDSDYCNAYWVLKCAAISTMLTLENTGSATSQETRVSDAVDIIKSGLSKADRFFEPKIISAPNEEKVSMESAHE